MPPHSTNVATLIAADRLEAGLVSQASDYLRNAGLEPGAITWLETEKAVDVAFSGSLENARKALLDLTNQIDIAVQPIENRKKMLLVSDMDSTMISAECIDELADYAGIKAEIAAITERAMAGELDFVEALTGRVALLTGLAEDVIQTCLSERISPMPGAIQLVRTMAGWGAHTVLVSGGFTSFTGPVAAQIGFAEVHANVLEIKNGHLTGRLIGAIVDAETKRRVLQNAASSCDLSLQGTLSVGDGANDIPMIEIAAQGRGLGVGFHPRPKLAAAANFSIRHGDLTALLYVQGIPKQNWVTA